MPISMANPGDTVIIRRITGTDKVKNHLAELGFVVDGEVTIISKVDNGIICNVKGSRIAREFDSCLQFFTNQIAQNVDYINAFEFFYCQICENKCTNMG